MKVVRNNFLPNFPITKDDIILEENIFRPNMDALKGKTLSTMPDHVKDENISVPLKMMKEYKEVNLCAYVMYINKIAFLPLDQNI